MLLETFVSAQTPGSSAVGLEGPGQLLSVFQGAVSGSVQASDRLMKELRDIYRSQSYKAGEHAPPGSSAPVQGPRVTFASRNWTEPDCVLTSGEGCETLM